MRISISWLKEFVDVKASAQEIADKLSVSGLEVEHLERWETVKGGLRGFVIGQVMECAKHPNADKLSVTKVDIGTGELQPIVCGAPNVASGQKVVVATVGTDVTVPGKGSFTIGEAKIRGEISRGMICAEDEMGMGTSHDGIMVLPDNAPVGQAAADYFKVASDEVLEIGLTANRGDAASHLGVARDVAALFNIKTKLPEVPARSLATGKWDVVCQASECSLYIALELKNIHAKPSPEWMQNRLRAIGIEPKNILVDATNYVLHSLGQPIHAFDADKLRGNKITVRPAQKGENFTTLDKIKRECKGGELVIADAKGPIAFAGVMGGLDSAVSESTQNILIESAHFNASLVRKTARAHGLNTDASFRFERSTDPEICRKAALYTADLIMQVAGGEIADINQCLAEEFVARSINFDLNKLNTFAGANIPVEKAKTILENLGFEVSGSAPSLQVKVPSWRNDVHEVVDLYEEVMRIFGYDNIPMTGKMSASLPVFEGFKKRKIEDKARAYLISTGFFEVVNNSLVSSDFYPETTRETMVELSNPLSSDMQFMRAGLLQGLLHAASYNRNRQNHNIRFFEFGNVYSKMKSGFNEQKKLGILMGGDQSEESWELKPLPMDAHFAKRQVQNVLLSAGFGGDPNAIASIKKVTAAELKQFDLQGDFFYAELDWNGLLQNQKPENFKVQEPPRFPYMRRDLSLVVDKKVSFAQLEKIIESQNIAILKNTLVFDVFEGKPLEEGKKAVAIAFYLGNPESTLTDADADTAMGKLMNAFETQTGAVIRR